MDKLTKEQRRKNMQHIKAKDTGIEEKQRKALWDFPRNRKRDGEVNKKLLRLICVSLLAFSVTSCGQAPMAEHVAETDRSSDEAVIVEGGMDFDKETVEDVPQDRQEASDQTAAETEMDFSAAFQGIEGCAVIYLPTEEQYLFFHEEMCRQEVSPYSTFKIISALSGLQNGVIADEHSTMGYDGTDYGNPEWNGDLTLEQAFQKSCVWYFRKVIDAVGKDEIQEELDELQYGNCDVSEWNGSGINPLPVLNGFWLDSSLKISPLGQVKVLEKIFEGQSGYERANIELLKKIMLTDESGTQKIYGKTGSSGRGEAWFIGFSEAEGVRKYFAIYLNDRSQQTQISGDQAKEIALEIIAGMTD